MIYNQKDKVAYFHVWNTFYSDIESSDKIILDIVKRLDIKKLIIDCGTEYSLIGNDMTNYVKELNLYVGNKNIEALLIVGSIPMESTLNYFSNFKVHSYPFYWLQKTSKIHETNENIKFTDFHKKNHTSLFYSHNHWTRDHRCLLVDYLAKYNLFKDGDISWNVLSSDMGETYDFLYWKEEIRIDPTDSAHDPKILNWHEKQFQNPGEKYINSLFDLVSETTPDCIFWTEKTWKPILYGKPFIIWGAKGINKRLKEYGFEIFENVVNYDFDDIEDEDERVEALCLELKRLSKLDYKNIDLQDRIEANKELAIRMTRSNGLVYTPPHSELFDVVDCCNN